MKNRKKKLALILSLVMAASVALTACDDSDDGSSSKKKKNKDQSSDVSVSSVIDDSSSDPGDLAGGDTSSDPDTDTVTTTTTSAAPESDPDDSSYVLVIEPDGTEHTVTTKADPVPDAENEITEKNVTAEQKPIYDYFMGLMYGDMDRAESSMPEKLVDKIKDMGMWESMKDIKTRLETKYGSDCEIKLYSGGSEKKELTDSEINDIIASCKNNYGVDITVEKAYYISIAATVTGSKGSDTDDDEMAVGLVDGKWVIIDMFV